MSVKCDIYEDEMLFTYSNNSENNYLVLPKNFKRVTGLYINGTKVPRIDESDISLDTDNNFRSITPTGYYLMNEFLYFNSKPRSGDSIYMTYDAQVEIEGLRSLHFPVFSYIDLGGSSTNTVYKDRAKTIAESKTVRASITIEANSDYDIYAILMVKNLIYRHSCVL